MCRAKKIRVKKAALNETNKMFNLHLLLFKKSDFSRLINFLPNIKDFQSIMFIYLNFDIFITQSSNQMHHYIFSYEYYLGVEYVWHLWHHF